MDSVAPNPFDPGLETTAQQQKCKAEIFIEKYCVHSKGEWAANPFNIQPWQRHVLRAIFGNLTEEGFRIIRNYYLSVPRKNGKSEFAAAIVLYLLLSDPEPGAEIYSAAKSTEQAKMVFDAVKRMVALSEPLQKLANQGRLRVLQNAVTFMDTLGTLRTYKAIAHEAKTAHGTNPSAVICDELHCWTGTAGEEFFEALTSGQGARRQPLTLMLTTAGYDKNSLCYEQYQLAKDIKSGKKEDRTFDSFITEAGPEEDWKDPRVWERANPSLGVCVYREFLENEVRKAENSPSETNKIRRFYLNQWTESKTVYISLDAWDACGRNYDEESLLQRQCFGGLDLASTTDLASFCLIFPPVHDGDPYETLIWFWLPADNMRERVLRDQVKYDQWAEAGFLKLSSGNVIDYGSIKGQILASREKFDLRQINFDPWNATGLVTQLMAEGVQMVQHRQGFASMSGPTKDLLAYVLSKRLSHDGNPVLRWNIANLTVREDDNGNVCPSKKLSREKIDGAVATIMALGGALGAREGSNVMPYNGEELLIL